MDKPYYIRLRLIDKNGRPVRTDYLERADSIKVIESFLLDFIKSLPKLDEPDTEEEKKLGAVGIQIEITGGPDAS